MRRSQTSFEAREQHILDAAASLMIQYGYDKTSMSDIAEQANITRAILYLHFDAKERLFEALLDRETRSYLQAMVEDLQTNPNSGTIAEVFRSAMNAVHRSPFLSALMKQDRRMFGQYLSQPDHLFQPLQSASVWLELLRAFQNVGAIRKNIDLNTTAYLINALAVGLITLEGDSRFGAPPPFDQLMLTVANAMDQLLTPEEDSGREAGRAILLQMTTAAQAQFEQSRKANVQEQMD
jgi:TetR/AcrR family acrAB operon transcriptional repressor